MSDTRPPPTWSLPRDAVVPDDPLAGCLVLLTRYFHRPYSAQTLTSGLPLVNDQLTPDLFVRAAARAGLSARVQRRRLDDISPLTLPVVLLLKDGRAWIAVRRETNGWMVVQPESQGGEAQMEEAALATIYSGYAIFVKPAFRFDPRADSAHIPRPRHWFWSSLAHVWPMYVQVLIASLLINVFALVTPLFAMNVYDRVVPNQAFETLWVLATGAGIVFVFDFIVRALRAYYIDLAGKRVDVMLSANVFERVLDLEAAARPPSVGALASHFQEFEAFRDFITSATITAVVDLPFVLLFLFIIWWIGGPLVLIPALVVPLVILISLVLQRPLGQVIQQSFRVASQRQATLIETLTGLETVKATAAESPAQRRWEQVIGELSRLAVKSRMLSTSIVNQATFLQQFASVSVVVFGVYLITEKELTVGGLIAATLLTNRALGPLSQVAGLISRFHQAKAGLTGMDRVMQLPVERPPGKSFVHRPAFQGAIEFRDVSFAYPGQDMAALTHVSFRIERGERVGIIGRIGSGKTTIEKLILGLYAPNEGSVWIDGVDLRQLDPAELRHHIGYVPQDVFLFYGTVKDNIVLSAPFVDDAAMLEAAEIAGVTEFVNRHPKGFDMPVGERGEGLSGGQRQSVAIARALLMNPPILLFDEPTNSLDNRSEEQFKQQLAMRLAGHTLVLVTHRASLLSLVTRLIVMEGGRVIADGPKEQVLEALSGGKLHVARS